MSNNTEVLVCLDHIGLEINQKEILQDIQLDIYRGEFITLLGANGCGKSSILKCIAGSYFPTVGKIVSHLKPHQEIVYLNQDVESLLFPCLTVLDNCLLWKLRTDKKYLELPKKADTVFFAEYLKAFNPKFVHHLQTPVSSLSGGEQQILLLALILLHPPKLLLLDEHTSALDPAMSDKVLTLTLELAKKHNISVVMTTHQLKQVANCPGRVIVLKNRRIDKIYTEKRPTMEEMLEFYSAI